MYSILMYQYIIKYSINYYYNGQMHIDQVTKYIYCKVIDISYNVTLSIHKKQLIYTQTS